METAFPHFGIAKTVFDLIYSRSLVYISSTVHSRVNTMSIVDIGNAILHIARDPAWGAIGTIAAIGISLISTRKQKLKAPARPRQILKKSCAVQ